MKIQLSQAEAEILIEIQKLLEMQNVSLPKAGKLDHLANSADDKEHFIISIVRRGLNPQKVSYSLRYKSAIILLRVDTENPYHVNPDGEELPNKHIHIYREGYAAKWAYPLPDSFKEPDDIVKLFEDFLEYANFDMTAVNISVQEELF
ncbi:MAG: hypothetical protein WCV63_06395 [Negativicutes bacterium]